MNPVDVISSDDAVISEGWSAELTDVVISDDLRVISEDVGVISKAEIEKGW